MNRVTPLISRETYHVYNRGAHKREVFTSIEDYKRFLLLLYLSNSTQSVNIREIFEKHRGRTLGELLKLISSEKSLVDILAYSLMPNHFHLVLRQKADSGITRFMHRVATAYSMYFNTKYEHSGVLFQGRFKSRHIDTESYYRWIFAYVHLNQVEIIEPGWKKNGVRDPDRIRSFLPEQHSSFYDYCVGERPERAILAYDDAPDFLKTQNDLEEMLADYSRGSVLYQDYEAVAGRKPSTVSPEAAPL